MMPPTASKMPPEGIQETPKTPIKSSSTARFRNKAENKHQYAPATPTRSHRTETSPSTVDSLNNPLIVVQSPYSVDGDTEGSLHRQPGIYTPRVLHKTTPTASSAIKTCFHPMYGYSNPEWESHRPSTAESSAQGTPRRKEPCYDLHRALRLTPTKPATHSLGSPTMEDSASYDLHHALQLTPPVKNNYIENPPRAYGLHSPCSALGLADTKKHDMRSSSLPEYGIWKCCACNVENHFHVRHGKHPVSTMVCRCSHKPCEQCKFTGCLKHFVPIQELIKVPKDVEYGLICKKCGLSWRAKEPGCPKKSRIHVPGFGKVKNLHRHRLTPIRGRLRKTQSMVNLVAAENTSDSDEAPAMDIVFANRVCTCGEVSGVDTFCFRLTGQVAVKAQKHLSIIEEGSDDISDPKLSSPVKGWSESSVIRVRSIEHPNPLRSNPVTASDLI